MSTREIPSPVDSRHSLFEHCGIADAQPLTTTQEISIINDQGTTISAHSVARAVVDGQPRTVWLIMRWAPRATFPHTWNMCGNSHTATAHIVARARIS